MLLYGTLSLFSSWTNFFRCHASLFDLIWFILLEERREPYTRLGVKQCMLRLNACVCACVRVEVPAMVGELKAKWEKLGRTIRMVWTRTGVRQKVLLCSSLELGQIFYALQVFGKFIKRACSEINWRWLIESCVWCRQVEVITLAKGAGWTCRGEAFVSKCWGAVLLASWKPSVADWYWRGDSSEGCWRVGNTSSWSEG